MITTLTQDITYDCIYDFIENEVTYDDLNEDMLDMWLENEELILTSADYRQLFDDLCDALYYHKSEPRYELDYRQNEELNREYMRSAFEF